MAKHILIAHDLSLEADTALRRAAQLASQLQARLTLLHVAANQPSSPASLAKLRSAGEETLTKHLREYPVPDAQLRLEVGQPAELILQYIGLGNCDLLVLGSHHRHPTQDFAGSTRERILRASPVPVLLAVDASVAPYHSALVATDLSPCASRALRQTWRLLPSGARLQVLHVHEMAEIHAAEEAEDSAMQQALFEQYIADERTNLPPRALEFGYSFRIGERYRCLDEALASQHPQLLALGAHSRDPLSDKLLGSMTLDYLQQPPCDLLLVR